MPETITTPPSAGIRIIDSGPPKPPPAPTREIRASDIDNMPQGKTPLLPGPSTARQSLRSAIASKAKPEGSPVTQDTPPPTPPVAKPAETPKAPEVAPATPPAEAKATEQSPSVPPAQKPAEAKPEKVNPWKRVKELEAENQKLKTSIVPEQERTSLEERVRMAETRAKELEDEIRHVDYSKSEEFKTKHLEPYNAAWKRAMNELSEISIMDAATGEQRAVTAQDLLALVNLPAGQAREMADTQFGKFANDVMDYRREIRKLFEEQTAALEDAKKNGAEREKRRNEETEQQKKVLSEQVGQTWKTIAEQVMTTDRAQWLKPKTVEEGKEFTPEETEWNKMLEHSKKIVSEGWAQNPLDPKLTPEQRQKAIVNHSAIYHRAIAYGPMKLEIQRLKAQLEKATKDLQAYSSSTPSAGGGPPSTTPAGPRSAKEQLFAAIAAKAH